MTALASVEYWCSDLRWCYLQQTVHLFFSSQIRTPSFPINWPSLDSTARSPNILWRLWSHNPLHKHESNKYQSKAFVICDHKSDETRSVTLVSNAYLVWLMFRVLSTSTAPIRNAVFQNRGVCGQAFTSFRSLSPVIPFLFFLPSSQLYWRTRAETLATQAKRFLLWSQRLCFRGLYWLFVYFSL